MALALEMHNICYIEIAAHLCSAETVVVDVQDVAQADDPGLVRVVEGVGQHACVSNSV